MKTLICFFFILQLSSGAGAQEINDLVQKVRARLETVSDYEAKGKMRTNVAFLKVPVASVKIYFKKPNRMKIINEKGISFIPRGAVNINLNNLLSNGKYSVLDAGMDRIGETPVKVVKLLPEDDNSDVVLSTLYIDESNLVIRRARTTTRDNGTYELELGYGKYTAFGLPDKVIFSFNTRDYKMPKGVTFDFEDGNASKKGDDKMKQKKGRVEITFNSYAINKGISDSVFR